MITILKLFLDVLEILPSSLEYDETKSALMQFLDSLIDKVVLAEGIMDSIFERCVLNFIQVSIMRFGNNLADYTGQLISFADEHQRLGLRMLKILSYVAKDMNVRKKISSLRMLQSRLPFMPEYSKEAEVIIASVVACDNEEMHLDADLVSQMKLEKYPSRVIPVGSVKATSNWFSQDLGIEASNRLFGLM